MNNKDIEHTPDDAAMNEMAENAAADETIEGAANQTTTPDDDAAPQHASADDSAADTVSADDNATSDSNDKTASDAQSTSSRPDSLAAVLREHASEDEQPFSRNFTLGKILGGDLLSAAPIRRQIWVVLLITFFVVIYITNRYSCQQYLIEIDNLNKELRDAKFKALSSTSMLTEMCRESRVLEQLRVNNDSVLHISKQPPFKIFVPKDE